MCKKSDILESNQVGINQSYSSKFSSYRDIRLKLVMTVLLLKITKTTWNINNFHKVGKICTLENGGSLEGVKYATLLLQLLFLSPSFLWKMHTKAAPLHCGAKHRAARATWIKNNTHTLSHRFVLIEQVQKEINVPF